MPEKVYIIAETGASHRQSYARAMALIDAARQAGADGIKFSAFIPSEMTSGESIIKKGPWKGRSLISLYEESFLSYDLIPDLKNAARAVGIDFILSIYHPNTIPIAIAWGCKTIKIASFEITYLGLLKAIAREPSFKNIILSTGCATEREIQTAVDIFIDKNLTLLHCTSYEGDELNLRTLSDMNQFNRPTGLSDHSKGIMAPVIATSMGATVIEKHLKLDEDGLDASFAIFPDQLRRMVDVIRETESIMGKVDYSGKKSYHRDDVDGEMLRVVW